MLDVSRDTAERVWTPLVVEALFQASVYVLGDEVAVTSVARAVPSSLKVTPATATLSVEEAVSVRGPRTNEPFAGTERLTSGGVASLLTVTEIVEVATLPAASEETAESVCEPFATAPAFHEAV